MEITRILQDTEVLRIQGWRTAAQEMLVWKWDLSSEINSYGQQIADAIVTGKLERSELEDGLKWASAHTREADKALGNYWQTNRDIHEEDLLEATARLLALGAGQYANIRTCNSTNFKAHREDYLGRLAMLSSERQFGLSRVKARDLGMGESLVNLKAKVKD